MFAGKYNIAACFSFISFNVHAMKRFCLLLITGICFIPAFAQDLVFLPPIELINLKKDFQYSSARLLKSYTEDLNKYRIVLPNAADSTVYRQDDLMQIASGAEAYHAKYFMTCTMNRIGEIVLINVALYETSGGKKVWWDKMKAAE